MNYESGFAVLILNIWPQHEMNAKKKVRVRMYVSKNLC